MMTSLTMAQVLEYCKVPGRVDGFCSDGSEQGYFLSPSIEGMTVDTFATVCFPGSYQEIMVNLLVIIKGALLVSGK